MSDFVSGFEAVRPRFEAAVYDGYALRGYPADSPELTPQRIGVLRRIIASNSFCQETSRLGAKFLVTTGTIPDVRLEAHVASDPEGDEHGHHFISVPHGDAADISPDDLVIDPTYLQFATAPFAPRGLLPMVFVGTRAEITAKMEDESFSRHPIAPVLYGADTALPFRTDFIA